MLQTTWHMWTDKHLCRAQWVARDLYKWLLQHRLVQSDECFSRACVSVCLHLCVCVDPLRLCVLWSNPKGDSADLLQGCCKLLCHNYLSTLAFTLTLFFMAIVNSPVDSRWPIACHMQSCRAVELHNSMYIMQQETHNIWRLSWQKALVEKWVSFSTCLCSF